MPQVHNTFLDRLQPRQDRRAIALDRKISTSSPSWPSGLNTTSDPYSANASLKIALDREPSLVVGQITEVVEYGRTYRVQFERGGPIALCCELLHTSAETMGSKQLNSYLPGTIVLTLWHPHNVHGIIIGALPGWMASSQDAISDYIVQGSGVGLNVDQVHSFPLNLNDNGGIVDWSAGRPFDHIADGDWGAVTDTGGMVFLDPFMTFMRMDEETGIFFFYDNQRGRLTAHNLQIRSGHHEQEFFDDQGEADEWSGYTTGSYYERMGKFEDGKRYRELQPEEYQFTEPWYTRFEPEDDEQQAFFRLRVFRGYLGQGDSKMLCIPPDGAEGVQRYSDQLELPGVAEDQWSTDGMVSIRSAKGLIIAKRAILPNPKQLILPEDPKGDTAENYRFNGAEGSGKEHKVGDIEDAGEHPSLVRAAAFRDLYALKEIHKDMLGLRYHETDWYVPNEQDYSFSGQMSDGIPDYGKLCDNQWLEPADPIQFKIDPRYGDVNVWPHDSYIALLEDGGINIADGFGSEIRMIDGSIIVSCPGDLWFLPGKSSITWAGWDVVSRANNCVDISSNACDVRIKAEKNCLIMGGNATCGGVLIESKAPAIEFKCAGDHEVVGGIILRAKHSAIVSYAAQIEMILSGEDTGHPPAIVMQAHDGLILTESKHFFRFLHQSAQDAFTDGDCGVCGVNEFWCTSNLFNSAVRVNGPALVNGCLIVAGDITCGQHVTALEFDILTDSSTIAAAVMQLEVRVGELSAWAGEACPDPQKLENDTDVTKLEFYFRSTEQQKMTDLIIFETKWQQEARLKGASVQTWTENPLHCEDCFEGQEEFFYPPPGKTAWVDDESLRTQDQKLFDISKNLMNEWGEEYEKPNPRYKDPEKENLDGTFKIIRNTCTEC